METERIALSERERDRLRVLHEVERKQITQREAIKWLKISDQHIRRLLVGLRKPGDRAVLHGLRGRPSNRRLAAQFEQQIFVLLHRKPTHHRNGTKLTNPEICRAKWRHCGLGSGPG
jgi:hypothetical protein